MFHRHNVSKHLCSRLCGTIPSNTIDVYQSDRNNMILKMYSGSFNTFRGFNLTYEECKYILPTQYQDELCTEHVLYVMVVSISIGGHDI